MTREDLEEYVRLRAARDVLVEEMEYIDEELGRLCFGRERRRLLNAKKDALSMELLVKEENIVDRMCAIEKAIDSLDDTEQTVLRMVYILGMTEEKAAEQLPCHVRTLQRIKERALKKIS